MTLTITQRAAGRYSVEFAEPSASRLVAEGCRRLELRCMRSRTVKDAWLVPHQQAADLEAWLTTQGARIEITL